MWPDATARAFDGGVQASSEVAARPVHGLAQGRVEARDVGGVPAVEFVRATGPAGDAGSLPLSDRAGPVVPVRIHQRTHRTWSPK